MEQRTRHPAGANRGVGRGLRVGRAVVALALCLTVAAACDDASQSPRPGGSPTSTISATLRPATTSSPRVATVPPSTPASTASWPAGWDAGFCDLFEEMVISQELAVDVGRALDEEARDDARALARELEETAQGASAMLADLPRWEPFDGLRPGLTRMLEIADAMGRFYGRYIDREREQALERVGELIDEQRPLVGDAVAGLNELQGEYGLSCPGHEFELESP